MDCGGAFLCVRFLRYSCAGNLEPKSKILPPWSYSSWQNFSMRELVQTHCERRRGILPIDFPLHTKFPCSGRGKFIGWGISIVDMQKHGGSWPTMWTRPGLMTLRSFKNKFDRTLCQFCFLKIRNSQWLQHRLSNVTFRTSILQNFYKLFTMWRVLECVETSKVVLSPLCIRKKAMYLLIRNKPPIPKFWKWHASVKAKM